MTIGTNSNIHCVRDAHERTSSLIADLADNQLMGPRLSIVNPMLWEIGHVAWFYEKWVLRHCFGDSPCRPAVDQLYDSAAIPHDTRWDLPLLSRVQTMSYKQEVCDRVLERLERAESGGEISADVLCYFVQLSLFHEDMHTEAFTYTRQTLAYSAPRGGGDGGDSSSAIGPLSGDAEVPGGTFLLGSNPGEPFVFDNEKWQHPVDVQPFQIALTAVTQGAFAEFVDAGGYIHSKYWCDAGWRWREEARAQHPAYWDRQAPGRWLRRHFDQWIPLEPNHPVIHVNWFEADAYCRWAGRRLPTEVEWELAACGSEEPDSNRNGPDRCFPWGSETPTPLHANLDWRAIACLDVSALPGGDSPFGCRQMIGNVWEWTSSVFAPYPGFSVDPYQEYSQPWFDGGHKVLRGGAYATRSRLIRNRYRNFYTPDRRDVLAGFRTCKI